MATTEERDTIELNSAFAQRVGDMAGLGDLAINKGAIVGIGATGIEPATPAMTVILGRAEESVAAVADRPSGVTSLNVRSGIFGLNNSGGAAVPAGGRIAGIVDDDTVEDGVGTSAAVALIVYKVTADSVYVVLDPTHPELITA